MKFKNPWGQGSGSHDKWFKNKWANPSLDPEEISKDASGELLEFFAEKSADIAAAAEKLGGNSVVMDHYWKFQTGVFGWFFSPNPKLTSATSRPGKLDSWNSWDALSTNQRQTLSDLAGFSSSTIIQQNNTDLQKLKDAITSWPSGYYSVFWSIPAGSNEETYTCNIFVGDVLHLAGKSTMTGEKKYYSAKQIYDAVTPFKKVEKADVVRGNIAAFGGTHLEIVTKVYDEEDFWGSGTTRVFCSRGGGRGSEDEMGTEKCGTAYFERDREVNDDGINFLTL